MRSNPLRKAVHILLAGTAISAVATPALAQSASAEQSNAGVTSGAVTPAPEQSDPAQQANANAAQGNSGNEIIVTGQRRLSRSPQDAKRQNLAVVDSVGALEIQKLTDSTVVEALTRLPGITFERAYQSQTAWYATIRGINGQYNSVDLDGGMFYDSTRNDREVYLDTVPASAVNELVVYKTVTPDMDPNSIGGHLSINTLRSFDLGGAAVTKGDFGLNLFQNNGAPNGHGPGAIGNIVVKRTFGPDHNFGFVGAASYHNNDYGQSYNNVSLAQINGVDVPTGSVQNGNFDIHDKGYSLLGKLEARSTDRFYGFIEATNFFSDTLQNNFRGGTSINANLVKNAAEGSGSFTGASAQAYTRTYDINRRLWTVTTGAEYRTSDNSKLKFVASMETSHHNETLTNGAFYQYNNLSGTYDLGAEGAEFNFAPSAGLSNPANWTLQPGAASTSAGSITYLPMTDHVYTARLDYNLNSFPFSHGIGFAAGANFRRLHRVFDQSADSYTLPNGTIYPLSSVLENGGKGSTFDGQGVVYIDSNAYWNFVKANGTLTHSTSPSSSYDLTEDVYSGYADLNYNNDKLHLLAGVRYEKTVLDDATATIDSSYFPQLLSGTISSASVPTTPEIFHRSYDYFLPNVQGYYDISPALRIKAAYTETIARPAFTAFAQGLTINNFSNAFIFLRGSNPDLNARHSRNFDLSLEYNSRKGYASVGVFHKNITGEYYFITQTIVDPTTGTSSQLTIPENASSDRITGVELSGEWHDFGAIAPWLNGFALRANYTHLWGEMGVVNTDGSTRSIDYLSNMPRYLFNVMAIYDRGPVTASLAYDRRGKSFLGVGSIPAADSYTMPYESLDARIAVRPFQHIEVFVAARNLLDGLYRETSGYDQKQTVTAIRSGRSFTLGGQFRF